MIRSKKRIWLCSGLLFANLALIWGNSLMTGAESGDMSGSLLAVVMELLNIPESYGELVHHLIRKAAHFTEFACLGALLTWRCGMNQEKHLMAFPVLCGMAVALADETIQMFTPDRGPSLTDVWIDTSGVFFGMLVLLTGYYLHKRIKTNEFILEEN